MFYLLSNRDINELAFFKCFGLRVVINLDHKIAGAAAFGWVCFFDQHRFVESAAGLTIRFLQFSVKLLQGNDFFHFESPLAPDFCHQFVACDRYKVQPFDRAEWSRE